MQKWTVEKVGKSKDLQKSFLSPDLTLQEREEKKLFNELKDQKKKMKKILLSESKKNYKRNHVLLFVIACCLRNFANH